MTSSPSLRSLPSPLYAILDLDAVQARGLAPLGVLEAWLAAGVRIVQLRAKAMPAGLMLALADQMLRRTRAAGASLLVNDRADVAAMAGADGVHLGQADLSPRAARDVVGSTAWVGLSTHTEAQLVAARDEPVTYVAIGPVFATTTKAGADPVVGLDGVRRAAGHAAEAGVPLVAIGGITLARAREVLAAGAASVAVIADLLLDPIEERAREYLRVLDRGK